MHSTSRLALVVLTLIAGCQRAGNTTSTSLPPSDAGAARDPRAVIEYQGQFIRLAKRYDDYDDYKSDPNNIAPDEYAHVQALVKAAAVPERCADVSEIIASEKRLPFPGYGSASGLRDRHSDAGYDVYGYSLEIPHANADRYIIYLKDDQGYRLVNDIVIPDLPMVSEVSLRGETIVYLTEEGVVAATRPIGQHQSSTPIGGQ